MCGCWKRAQTGLSKLRSGALTTVSTSPTPGSYATTQEKSDSTRKSGMKIAEFDADEIMSTSQGLLLAVMPAQKAEESPQPTKIGPTTRLGIKKK